MGRVAPTAGTGLYVLAAACFCAAALFVSPAGAADVSNQAEYDAAILGAGDVVINLQNDIVFDTGHQPVAGSGLTGITFNTGTVTTIVLQGGYVGGAPGTPGAPVGKNAAGNPNATFLNGGRWMVTPSVSNFTLANNVAGTTVVIQGFGIRGNDNIRATGNRGDESHGGALWTQGGLTISGAGNFTFANNTIDCGLIDMNATPAPSNGRIPAGYGAAIYADGDLLLQGSGVYTFENNSITGGDALNGAGNFKVAAGAALYVKGYFETTGSGTYIFKGNNITGGTVNGGGDISGSGHQNGQGQGGAIDGTTLYFRGTGAMSFVENRVQGGDAIGTNAAGTVASRAMNGGLGGAILSFPYGATQVLFENSGDYEFLRNKAMGGDASGGATTDHSGLGGGIYTESLTIFKGSGDYLFEGNEALGGDGSGGSIVTDSGWGGAIAAALNTNMGGSDADLTFEGDGSYLFSQNKALGGETDATSDGSYSGQGGAIYSDGSVTFAGSSVGEYAFTGNAAASGNLNAAGGEIHHSGQGGAIFSTKLLTIMDHNDQGGADYTFANNQALGGLSTAGDAGSSGRGGAIYVDADIDLAGSGFHSFSGNSAVGGDADGDYAYTAKSGVGGAIYAKGDTEFAGSGDYGFSGNQAVGGSAAAGGNASRSGQGGAINGNAIFFQGIGSSYSFTNNLAQGGNAAGTDSAADTSGQGGAIFSFSGDILMSDRSSYYFSGNRAVGGSATGGGDASGSGQGGAIYSAGNLYISNAAFTNNRAESLNSGDMTSGLGGAIYHRNNSAAGLEVLISSSEGKDVLFSGNTQNRGNTGAVANSIFFDTTSGSQRTTELAIHTDADSSVFMYDPMASRDAVAGGTAGVAVNVEKTGDGTWVLAGHNDMQGGGTWKISEGTLYLTRIQTSDAQAAAGNRTLALAADTLFAATAATDSGIPHIDLGEDGTFILDADATIMVGVDGAMITADTIILGTGSSLVIDTEGTDFFGTDLSTGAYDVGTLLDLNGDTVVNNVKIDAIVGGNEFSIRQYDYVITRAPTDPTSYDIVSKTLNAARAGVSAVSAPAAIIAALPGSKVLNDHMRDNFLLPCEKRLGTDIWATGFHNYLDQRSGSNRADYDVKVPGFSVGIDHWFGNSFFVGVAGVFSWPDYESRHADVDGHDITGLVYGGAVLPYDIGLSFFGGYGRTSLDQDRRAEDFGYSNDYDSDNLFLGVGLSKDFRLGRNWLLTPFANYEYIHADVDGWREDSLHNNALGVDNDNLDMHRLILGLEGLWQRCPGGAFVKGKVYYQGLYGDNRGKATAFYVNDPALERFSVRGDRVDRNMFGVGVAAGLPLGERARLEGGYDFKIGKDTLTHTGYVNVSFRF